jgi:hypothetical protein
VSRHMSILTALWHGLARRTENGWIVHSGFGYIYIPDLDLPHEDAYPCGDGWLRSEVYAGFSYGTCRSCGRSFVRSKDGVRRPVTPRNRRVHS